MVLSQTHINDLDLTIVSATATDKQRRLDTFTEVSGALACS